MNVDRHAWQNLLFILLGVLVVFTATACGADSIATAGTMELTLKQAIDRALKQNRDVLIAEQDQVIAGAQVQEARANALPYVSMSGQYIRYGRIPVIILAGQAIEIAQNNSYTAAINVAQPLFNRKVGTALQIADTYKRFYDTNLAVMKNDITLLVIQQYYSVLLMQQLVEVNRQSMDVVEANLKNVRSQFENGTAAEFDLLRAEVEFANTKPQLISAENDLELTRNGLKNLLALPLDSAMVLKDEFVCSEIPESTLVAARGNAFANNPSLAQLSLQETLMRQNVSVVKADYYPSLNLIGSYQWQAQDNTYHFHDYTWSNSIYGGLQLSFTLFDGFGRRSQVHQATADLRKVHLARIKAEEGLLIQIRSAESRIEEARKKMEAQQQSLGQAEKALAIAQTRFRNGISTLLELLDTQTAMTLAKTNFSKAVYDYLIAQAEWQYYVGKLN